MQDNSKWKQIWENRTLRELDLSDSKSVFMELKRCNGFDILENGVSYQDYKKQFEQIERELRYGSEKDYDFQSIFEVGCGSGANLYLPKKSTGGGVER